MNQSQFKRSIGTAVCTAILIAGSVLSSTAAAEVFLPPFYNSVSQMEAEGKLGQIIKKQKISTPVSGAQAWLIAYISSDVNNRKTISTGLVVAPVGQPPKDGRPVVSWSHGTTGMAQNCGPSQTINPAVPLNEYFLVGGNSWTDYGMPALEEFIKEGYVVVATDYQGQGGGGKHQYAVAATQGRDAINAIRAAGAMKDTGAGKNALVYGWSQGGGSVLAAASSGDYINQKGTAFDGINIVGFVALAPEDMRVVEPEGGVTEANAASMMNGLTNTFSDNVFNFTHLTMTMLGTQAAYSDKLKLSDLYTDEGAKVVEEVLLNKCMHPAADTFNYAYADQYKTLMKPQIRNAKAWADAIVAGSVPNVKPVAPVIIYFGTHDTAVPPVMGKIYREQMCAKGGNVARVQLAGEITHFGTPGASKPLYLPWVKDLFSGKPAADGCAAN